MVYILYGYYTLEFRIVCYYIKKLKRDLEFCKCFGVLLMLFHMVDLHELYNVNFVYDKFSSFGYEHLSICQVWVCLFFQYNALISL